MVLTGKQRRFLRALGVQLPATLQVGKGGVSPPVVAQAEAELTARELIKGRALQACPLTAAEAAAALAEATGAHLVQVVGRNFLLYRAAAEMPQIELPPGRI